MTNKRGGLGNVLSNRVCVKRVLNVHQRVTKQVGGLGNALSTRACVKHVLTVHQSVTKHGVV